MQPLLGQNSNYLNQIFCHFISVLQPVESVEVQAAKNASAIAILACEKNLPPLAPRKIIEVNRVAEDELHDAKDIGTVTLNSNKTVYSKILHRNDSIYSKILDCHKAVYSKVLDCNGTSIDAMGFFGKQHVEPPKKKPRKQSNPKKYIQWFISNDAMATTQVPSPTKTQPSFGKQHIESPKKKARKQSNPKPCK